MDNGPRAFFRRGAQGFVRGAFAVALALLLVLMLRSIAVQLAPPPGPRTEPYPDTSTQERCDAAGGRWIPTPLGKFSIVGRVPEAPPAFGHPELPSPFCQGPLAFEREREIQENRNRQTSLFVFALGGAIAVAGGLLVPAFRPVTPGLMLGGIIAFAIAGFHIWTLAPGLGRLVTIIVIFLVLLGIGTISLRDKKDAS